MKTQTTRMRGRLRSVRQLNVIQAVTTFLGITPHDLADPRRSWELVKLRHAAIFLIIEISGISMASLGRFLGKNHGTIVNAVRKAKDHYDTEADFRKLIEHGREHLAEFQKEEA